MSTPTKPSLQDAAKRNAAIAPERVRQMQEVVKQLQDRGVLKPSKYGVQPALGGSQRGLAATQGIKTMNRVGGISS
jgi:hypothetical protein